MRRLALLSLVPATMSLTAPALRPRARGRFLRSSPDDDEAPPEISEDFRDFRARLIPRTKGEGLTEAGDESSASFRLLRSAGAAVRAQVVCRAASTVRRRIFEGTGRTLVQPEHHNLSDCIELGN